MTFEEALLRDGELFGSRQRAVLPRRAVDEDEAGARALALAYWRAVEATTARAVRAVVRPDGAVALRPLRRGPALLRFGAPRVTVGGGATIVRQDIEGGLLTRRAGGWIELVQLDGDPVVVTATVEDYLPSLAARPGRPGWTGTLYVQLQARLHRRVARRFFAALAGPGRSRA